jgi:hypothetical protein
VDGRSNILGLGLEWFLPLAFVIGSTILVLTLLGVPALYQALFTGAGLLWGHFLFGAMHTSMHKNDFWMLRYPVLKTWYLRLRARHDFHHPQFSDRNSQKRVECSKITASAFSGLIEFSAVTRPNHKNSIMLVTRPR